MTTDTAFKRVVRARMAKTGERYAAARRTLIEGATGGSLAGPTSDTVTPSGDRVTAEAIRQDYPVRPGSGPSARTR